MLITFTVKDQKVTHDLKQTLVSGSVGIIRAVFLFDESWDGLDKIVVFKNSKSCKPIPVRYEDSTFDIPPAALLPGKLYVSCVGFGEGGVRKNTQGWDIQQAITVQKCGDMGGCDLLRNIVQVPESKVATDDEFVSMMKDVFGEDYGSGSGADDPSIDSDEIATDEEVQEMFAEVFGAKGHGS
jgi:hypothetical protein